MGRRKPLGRAAGHDHLDLGPKLDELGGEIGGLVSRDGAGHSERDAPSF